MHHHGYSFQVQVDQILSFDSARRPGGQGFDTAIVPPEKTSAWLQCPGRMVKGTWDEPEAAVAWLRQQYAEVAGSIMHPELNTEAPSVDVRAASAVEQLAGGNDVVRAWWGCPAARTSTRPWCGAPTVTATRGARPAATTPGRPE